MKLYLVSKPAKQLLDSDFVEQSLQDLQDQSTLIAISAERKTRRSCNACRETIATITFDTGVELCIDCAESLNCFSDGMISDSQDVSEVEHETTLRLV